MSAPLVINLVDGSVWERRAVSAAGVALYALAGSCRCPEYLMASESELAAQGIAGSADVLPVPVGPESQALSAERLAEIAARAGAATPGPWCTDAWEIYQGAKYEPGLSMWIGETCRGTSTPEQDRADAEFIAHARTDVPALLARVAELEAQRERRRARLVALDNDALSMRGSLSPMGEDRKVPFELGETLTPAVDWLIARVAELEAERHVTNEALDDAVRALRGDGITRRFAPTQALRDDKPAEAPEPGACTECGDGPSKWCVGCAKCSCEPVHDKGCMYATGGAS